MKLQNWIAANAALLLAATATLQAQAEALTRFDARPGSNIRVEGTSSMHDWQLEGKIIGGYIEVGPTFPTEPGQTVQPGKIEGRVEAFIPIRSLASVQKDGKPYSTKMDDIVYEKLKEPANKRITYRLSELTLKEAPKAKDGPYVLDSKGDLVVAGKTNRISMPVNVTPLGDKKLKLTGTTKVKMTDFGITPPKPALAMGLITTGDDVTLFFTWMLAAKPAAAAAAPAATAPAVPATSAK